MIDQCVILILDDRNTAMRASIMSCRRKYRRFKMSIINISNDYHIQGCELSKLTLDSKLIIISHGDKFGCYSLKFGYLHAFNMYRLLVKLGLKAVGLISFKGCSIGAGVYLEQLKAVIGNTIDYYYMLAYKKNVSSLFNHDSVGYLDGYIRMFTFNQYKLPDHYRVKIIVGSMTVYQPFKDNNRWRHVFYSNQNQ